MKVLIDPLYSGRPSTCSSSYVAWEMVEYLGDKYSDAFFYMLVPQESMVDEDQQAFWKAQKHSDRVQLIALNSVIVDRMSALLKFPDELVDIIAPNSPQCWDADIVLTSRIAQIANFRANSAKPVGFKKGTYRAIIGLDDVPMLGFRDTVFWGNTGHFDMHTMAQYRMADAVIMNGLWNKRKTLQLARQYFSPSTVMSLDKDIHEALSVKTQALDVSKPKYTGGEFNVVFTGRITGTRNFKEVAELFRKHFAFAIGKGHVKFLVSTQSMATGAADPGEVDFITFEHNSREQFYQLLKERAHVAVNLSTVEDFSLSTYEPMLFGVPVIVPNRDWSAFLGPQYPFRAENFVDSYAMVDQFLSDYAGQYERFRHWHQSFWLDFVEGPKNRSTGEVVHRIVDQHMADLAKEMERGIGGSLREIAERIHGEAFDQVDIVKYVREHKLITYHDDWSRIPVARRPNVHMLKLLLASMGWKDTLQTGVMIRSK